EHGRAQAFEPTAGEQVAAADELVTASTVTEHYASHKVGDGLQETGYNAGNESLDRVRADATGQVLSTNQGVRVADNQNSLKAGLRGPSLLEDFILREKLTHFDHERIPERVVHARGSGAHGYFECYDPLLELTQAAPFAAAGKRTPVFVRFSTVAGERGSADTVRDVRGFAVKFYTEDGNWDLVGNNMPVFFIQDAMKFPDLVHALKPEPHHAMPQASSAHDTFWDFVSLMPESTHMLMWLMSDRALPRSYRMMQGFGVHTFRLVNAQGEARLCKFHWTPVAGTHSLLWDEAVKIAGADPDFHRRDLWEAIEAGLNPEWELGLQVFSEEEAERFSFDVLDPTKLIPEELVPLRPAGRLVLTRNPDNFFAETEQVAFCTAHLIPGIDFTSDPLLQGRIHSYVDTQLTRLGGPNFHEIPINTPTAQVHNHQRDGMHRQTLARGRIAYEPNSLGGGCPFQAGRAGFVSFPEPVEGEKLRAKPERFAEHHAQARLFWHSQTLVEQAHLVAAFRFELSRVQVPAVRMRMLSQLACVDARLAGAVAAGLGMGVPEPQPLLVPGAAQADADPPTSPGLSLMARPGDGSLAGRRVALLCHEGMDAAGMRSVHAALLAAGAVPRFLGRRLGSLEPRLEAEPLPIEITLEAAPSVLWDALVLPDGPMADGRGLPLQRQPEIVDFVREQFRHCKPLLLLGDAVELLRAAGVPEPLLDGDPELGLFRCEAPTDPALQIDADSVARFIAALARHRHFEREVPGD
ncbi:MAG TPA: catalase, partial [Burkholderiaceae bacterium]|nr:catalase [Burkholderiaceae bacterium]